MPDSASTRLIVRGVAVTALAAAAVFAAAIPSTAAPSTPEPGPGDVVVVDEPDTSELNDIYTFAPLGVPVFGLLQSLNAVPGKLLPSATG